MDKGCLKVILILLYKFIILWFQQKKNVNVVSFIFMNNILFFPNISFVYDNVLYYCVPSCKKSWYLCFQRTLSKLWPHISSKHRYPSKEKFELTNRLCCCYLNNRVHLSLLHSPEPDWLEIFRVKFWGWSIGFVSFINWMKTRLINLKYGYTAFLNSLNLHAKVTYFVGLLGIIGTCLIICLI